MIASPLEIGLHPAKARCGVGPGLIFAADPVVIAEAVEFGEHEVVVDLAGTRFVAAGIVGDLHVPDAVLEADIGADQVALHHLHVVKVILEN